MAVSKGPLEEKPTQEQLEAQKPKLPTPVISPLPLPTINPLLRNLVAGAPVSQQPQVQPSPQVQQIIQQFVAERNRALIPQPATPAKPKPVLRRDAVTGRLVGQEFAQRRPFFPAAIGEAFSQIGGSVGRALETIFGPAGTGTIGVPGGIKPEILRPRVEAAVGLTPSRMDLGAPVTPAETTAAATEFGTFGGPQLTAGDLGFDDPERTLLLRADFMANRMAQGIRPVFIPFSIQELWGLTDAEIKGMSYRIGPNGWIREQLGPAPGGASSGQAGSGGSQVLRLVGGGGRGSGGSSARASGLINWRI